MTPAGQRVVVIGIGNPWRHDDGTGWAAVDLAAARLGPDVVTIQSDGEPARLIDAWAGADLAVVVDATRTGAAAGTIHHLEAAGALPQAVPPLAGSHTLGLAEAVCLGRVLGRIPRRLVVFGIEAADTTAGEGLSPAAAVAVHTVADAIERAVRTSSPGSDRCA
jgi:hydrogenase maturation protease